MSQIHPETLAAHGGNGVAEPYRDIVQPIHRQGDIHKICWQSTSTTPERL